MAFWPPSHTHAAPSGPMVNTATVVPLAGYVDTSPGNDSASDTVTIRGAGNLAIAKTVTPTGVVVRGGTVTYTVTATNTSPLGDTAIGANVVDTLPAGIASATWTCAAASGSSCGATTSGSGNINQAVNVANGVPVVFTITGTVSPTATLNAAIANTATVAAPATFNDTGGANTATASNTVRPSGNLSVTNTVSKPSVARSGNAIGRQVLYTVVVANGAGGDPMTALLTESTPAGLTFNSWTCGTPSGGGTCAAASGSGRPVNASSTVPGGGSVTYRITATVNTNAALGALNNTVTVAPAANFIDPVLSNNTATATVTVTA